MKEQPLFPDSYLAVKEKEGAGNQKLLFTIDGTHLEYRQIEHAYNQAFKAAGLTFTATHVMRHGGTRRVYRQTKNLETAKQVLGDTDLQTVLVYAKADAMELTAFAHEERKRHESLVSTDIKRACGKWARRKDESPQGVASEAFKMVGVLGPPSLVSSRI
ncbi:MAG: tyrosine-type recombinase/integrase [Bdellovibrionota bacterium]